MTDFWEEFIEEDLKVISISLLILAIVFIAAYSMVDFDESTVKESSNTFINVLLQ
jgi:hypothetical protein